MTILDASETRHMAEQSHCAEKMLRLYDNPELGEYPISPPFRYVSPSVQSIGFWSNCYGTAAYILDLEDEIAEQCVNTHDPGPSNYDRWSYVLLPEKSAGRPGYVGPKYMEKLIGSKTLSGTVRTPVAGDLVMFSAKPALSQFEHCGVFIGVLNGCNVMFHQEDFGHPFQIGILEEYIAKLMETRKDVLPSFYRKN